MTGTATLNEGGNATVNADTTGTINLVGTATGLVISGLSAGGTASITISGFSGTSSGNSDVITLAGVDANDVTAVDYVDGYGVASSDYVTLTLKTGGKITLHIPGVEETGYSLGSLSDGSLTFEVCFLAGSMIRVPGGEVAVEDLRIGDKVLTYDWVNNKEVVNSVRWIGNKTTTVKYDLPDDEAGYPVRVAKDAIAEGVPYKDLLVTAEHCLFFDGKFVPVRMLVNGSSIRYDYSITDYTYYHIETEEHSVIWADGMLTESYLDTGNRGSFKQHGSFALFVSKQAGSKTWEKEPVHH